jgi:hypothetical protein
LTVGCAKAAISDSWKEQTLLNTVKLRYADMPLFVEMASIGSGYTLESSVNLSAKFFDGGSPAEFDTSNSASIGGSGKYMDRPTITYSPITPYGMLLTCGVDVRPVCCIPSL